MPSPLPLLSIALSIIDFPVKIIRGSPRSRDAAEEEARVRQGSTSEKVAITGTADDSGETLLLARNPTPYLRPLPEAGLVQKLHHHFLDTKFNQRVK